MARPGGRGNGVRRSRGSGAGRIGRRLDCVDADDGSGGDGVARAAILAEAGGRLRTTGSGRPVADDRLRATLSGRAGIRGLLFAKTGPDRRRQEKTAAPEGGRVMRRNGVARRSVRYSAMSAEAFAGRAGALPVACDGVLTSIFGGGDNCSTSLVYVHSSTTFAGLSFSFVP
ncbi:hypothetical protein BLA15816_01944 [Burkholderia lata]|nr:hypothetical protein BLA15816_01944 [Burkholderia lata]